MDGDTIVVTNQDAFEVTQWLEKGVFKALEDQYMDQLTFAIFTAHPVTGEDLLLETYEFKCTYPGINAEGKRTKPKVNNQSLDKNTLKAQANKFVRSLIEFSNSLEDIPEERWITIELAYTANCPSNYQPEYFLDNTGNGIGFSEGTDLLKIKIGNIKTNHHSLDVRFKGREQLDKESLSIFDEHSVLLPNEGRRLSEANRSYSPPSQDDHLEKAYSYDRARSNSCSSFVAHAPAFATTYEGQPSPPSSSLRTTSPSPAVTTIEANSSINKSGDLNHFSSAMDIFAVRKSHLCIDTEMINDGPRDPDLITAHAHVKSNHQRVREYILQQDRSVLKESATALRLPTDEVRHCFQHLLNEGFLGRGKGGSSYVIADREAGQGLLPVISPGIVREKGSRTDCGVSSGCTRRFFQSEKQEVGGSPLSDQSDCSETDNKMNQSLESDVSVGVGPDSETQDVAITLREPQNGQVAVSALLNGERDSLSDQSVEYLPPSKASDRQGELDDHSNPLSSGNMEESLEAFSTAAQLSTGQSQKEIYHAIQEHRRRGKRGIDNAPKDEHQNKSRKTSIIACPVRMKPHDKKESTDLGSQLNCYGYSSGQPPRSQ